MQEQLFKLYHNERDIERLSDELRARQKELDRLVSGLSLKYHDHSMGTRPTLMCTQGCIQRGGCTGISSPPPQN